ncbi:MAG: hydrogenase maturation nickel metallochaperone HypA [Chloroflexota bacterium]|nr:hydrogenase maturation nickel metallochaperone HypA [Anaerolineales bacterium]
MHELAVTQSILDLALKHADQAAAKRVTDIHIVLGELSSNVDDSIQFYWDIIARETLAEGARLHFQRVPAEFECLNCSHKYNLAYTELVCPDCGSTRVKIISGEEFYLDAIEVE